MDMSRAGTASQRALWIAVAIFVASAAFGAATSRASAMTTPDSGRSETEVPAKPRFTFMSVFQASSSLHHLASADHASDAGLLLMPSLLISDRFKVTAQLGVSQNLENERETRLSNTKLILGHKRVTLNPFLSVIPAAAVTVATNKESIQRDSLQGALHLQPRLDIDFSRLGLKALSLSNQLAITRNIHQYTTTYTGQSNTELSILDTIAAEYAFSDHVSLSATFARGTGRTYHGAYKNSFEMTQALNLMASEHVTLSIGHSNSGDAYKENGRDSNLTLFNPNDSQVFGYLTLVF